MVDNTIYDKFDRPGGIPLFMFLILRPLKVSKYLKQILKFSFEPKIKQNYFCILAIVSKKRSNQKEIMALIGGFFFEYLTLLLPSIFTKSKMSILFFS